MGAQNGITEAVDYLWMESRGMKSQNRTTEVAGYHQMESTETAI